VTSTLGYALLGVLSRWPLTGYEITQHMKAPIGYQWTAQHSQIYPELARLTKAGLLSYEKFKGRGSRANKRYSLTEAGRVALADWADSPLAPEVPRSEMLLRVRSLWLTSPERAINFVEAQRQLCLDRLDQIAIGRVEFAPDDLVSWDHPEFFAWATLQHRSTMSRALLAWCDWLLDQLHRQQRGEHGAMLITDHPEVLIGPPTFKPSERS
jgi:DNA-binding PadR family transcriptional regulator